MQLGCGGCSVQQVSEVAQILMNPATWVVLGAAVVTLMGKKKKQEKK